MKKFIVQIFLIIFNILIKQISSIDFTYPSAISLVNNNFFVVEKTGIYVYDKDFSSIVKSYPFGSYDQLDTLDKLSNVIVKYQYNYIICLINSKVYFFDKDGNKLNIANSVIQDSTFYYPTLAPIFVKNNNYYYVIGYFIPNGSNFKLKLILYEQTLSGDYSYKAVKSHTDSNFESYWNSDYDFRKKGLSCEYMVDDYKYEYYYLLCFFIIKDSDHEDLAESFYEVSTTNIDITTSYRMDYIETSDIVNTIQIKTVASGNLRYALVALLFSNNVIKYYKYRYEWGRIDKNSQFFETVSTNLYSRTGLYSMKLHYLTNYNNYIILSCINENAKVQAIILTDSLTQVTTYDQFESCNTIYGHNIVYSPKLLEYYVISDVICGKYKRVYEPLDGELAEITEYIPPTTVITTIPTTIMTTIVTTVITTTVTTIPTTISTTIITTIPTTLMTTIPTTIITTIPTTIPSTMIQTTIIETQELEKETTHMPTELTQFYNCSNLIKCSLCGEESISKNLCLECNTQLNYYYLNKNPTSFQRPEYIDCVNEETKPSNFYFNNEKNDYEMCYTTCAECNFYGNEEQNNCTKCDEINFIQDREEANSTNCVYKCRYYITENGIRQCVKECPEDYDLFIDEVNKCIDECSKDREYKYRYNGKCFKECPNNTNDDDGNYLCKDIELNKCLLTINYVDYLNENYTAYMAEYLVIKYLIEFSYTTNHVTQYIDNDNIYRLTIYMNRECIFDLGLQIPEIDFKNCETKIRDFYRIKDDDFLIIAILDKKVGGKNIRKILSHGMFDPITGHYLNPNNLCDAEKINFIENIENKLTESGIKLEIFKEMKNEGVDIFDLSSPFYKDVCFQYNSKKDIALKDRVLMYFPNVSLCDDSCQLKGINTTSLEAICECEYSDTQSKDALKDSALYQSQVGTIEELLNSINIYLLKCVDLILKPKNIIKCYGGMIILALIIIQTICAIIFCSKSLYHINKYFFNIINKYLNYLRPKSIEDSSANKRKTMKAKTTAKKSAPPKHKKSKTVRRKVNNKNNINHAKIRKSAINPNIHIYFNNGMQNNNSNNLNFQQNKVINLSNDKEAIYSKNKISDTNLMMTSKENLAKHRNTFIKRDSSLFINLKDNIDINFEEYLETELDDMDYYDAIRKDKRSFCKTFWENLQSNQLIINTFCMNEPFKPRPIKILLLVLEIDLYLLVNGMFFNEEYISKIFHLKKDDILSMSQRFLENLLYATLVGVISNYIIELFFIEEQEIKKILKREKDDTLNLKFEMIKILKSMKRRYVLFIIISYIITLFSLVHISIFNVVYKHTMYEWIIFSFLIIVLIQLFSFVVCLLQSILRFISFKLKSEKIYKLSLLMSEFL